MDGFIGEIKAFSFGFTPEGWLPCNGYSLPITNFTALYSIINTRFGGDGISNFLLPNLNGRITVGAGQSPKTESIYNLAQNGGSEYVTLTNNNLPSHKHSAAGAVTTGQIPKLTKNPSPTTYLSNIASQTKNKIGFAYSVNSDTSDKAMLSDKSIGNTGEGKEHYNMAPYLPINYCICYLGTYPVKP